MDYSRITEVGGNGFVCIEHRTAVENYTWIACARHILDGF
jgi:hypothetical protein